MISCAPVGTINILFRFLRYMQCWYVTLDFGISFAYLVPILVTKLQNAFAIMSGSVMLLLFILKDSEIVV